MSELWLVTVERRMDMKLLLVERSSCGLTRSSRPRHGMYLANANLQTDQSAAAPSGRASQG